METELEMKVVVATATCVVSGKELSKAVQTVRKAVSPHSTLPVLANVLLESKDNVLTLTGTNLEIGIRVVIPAVTLNDFAISVPPDPLIAASKAKEVSLFLDADDQKRQRLHLNGMVIMGIHADDFPPMPTPHHMRPIPDLADAIKHTAFAASKDEARPVIQGIQFENGLAIATDGFRIATYPVQYTGDPLIIPAYGLSKIANLIGKDAQIGYTLKRFVVFITSGNMTYTSQLIDGNYPDWRAIVLKSHKFLAVFDADTMLNAVKIVHSVAKEGNNVTRLDFQDGYIHLTAHTEELGTAEADVLVVGTAAPVAFNCKFLMDWLSIVEGKVTFKMNANNTPGQFECGKSTCVVMPMYLG